MDQKTQTSQNIRESLEWWLEPFLWVNSRDFFFLEQSLTRFSYDNIWGDLQLGRQTRALAQIHQFLYFHLASFLFVYHKKKMNAIYGEGIGCRQRNVNRLRFHDFAEMIKINHPWSHCFAYEIQEGTKQQTLSLATKNSQAVEGREGRDRGGGEREREGVETEMVGIRQWGKEYGSHLRDEGTGCRIRTAEDGVRAV